jgi:hypothetical protein
MFLFPSPHENLELATGNVIHKFQNFGTSDKAMNKIFSFSSLPTSVFGCWAFFFN